MGHARQSGWGSGVVATPMFNDSAGRVQVLFFARDSRRLWSDRVNTLLIVVPRHFGPSSATAALVFFPVARVAGRPRPRFDELASRRR